MVILGSNVWLLSVATWTGGWSSREEREKKNVVQLRRGRLSLAPTSAQAKCVTLHRGAKEAAQWRGGTCLAMREHRIWGAVDAGKAGQARARAELGVGDASAWIPRRGLDALWDLLLGAHKVVTTGGPLFYLGGPSGSPIPPS